MKKGVIYGNSLLIDILSHMKRKKNPGHFDPKVKVRRSNKLLLDNIWTTRGKSEYEERWGGIMSSPHRGVCSPLLCVTDTLTGTSTAI